MKILGIIPARAGSKRVKNKNKRKLAGKELVRYAIEASLQTTLLTTIVVSSDDHDILNIAAEYTGIQPLKRPEAIADDMAPAIAYVQHAIEVLKTPFDYIVIIQPTSPFTTGKDIDQTIQILLDSDADSSVSVMKLDHAIHPVKMKVLDGPELKPYMEAENGRMAAHELPELYVRNCSVYVSTIENIRKGKIIGDHCLAYVMPRERSIDINDPIDFEFAEFILEKYGK